MDALLKKIQTEVDESAKGVQKNLALVGFEH